MPLFIIYRNRRPYQYLFYIDWEVYSETPRFHLHEINCLFSSKCHSFLVRNKRYLLKPKYQCTAFIWQWYCDTSIICSATYLLLYVRRVCAPVNYFRWSNRNQRQIAGSAAENIISSRHDIGSQLCNVYKSALAPCTAILKSSASRHYMKWAATSATSIIIDYNEVASRLVSVILYIEIVFEASRR